MSDFTTEFRYLIDSGYSLGLDKYPIFDENYRETLNNLIKNHFYFYEIGFDSAQRFVFELNNVMREIMPYYNQLYNAELLSYDPFVEFSKELKQSKDNTQNVFDKLKEIIDGKITMDSTSKTDTLSTTDTTSNIDSNSTQNDNSKVKSSVTQNDNSSFEEDSLTNVNGNDNSISSNNNKSVGSNTPKDLLNIGTIENNVYATTAQIEEGNSIVDNTANNETDFKHSSQANNNSNVETDNDSESFTSSTDNSISNIDSIVDTDSTIDVDSSTIEDKTTIKDSEISTIANEEILQSETGHNSSITKLIVELRNSFINVDYMILNDIRLQECFMMVYGSH